MQYHGSAVGCLYVLYTQANMRVFVRVIHKQEKHLEKIPFM